MVDWRDHASDGGAVVLMHARRDYRHNLRLLRFQLIYQFMCISTSISISMYAYIYINAYGLYEYKSVCLKAFDMLGWHMRAFLI